MNDFNIFVEHIRRQSDNQEPEKICLSPFTQINAQLNDVYC